MHGYIIFASMVIGQTMDLLVVQEDWCWSVCGRSVHSL